MLFRSNAWLDGGAERRIDGSGSTLKAINVLVLVDGTTVLRARGGVLSRMSYLGEEVGRRLDVWMSQVELERRCVVRPTRRTPVDTSLFSHKDVFKRQALFAQMTHSQRSLLLSLRKLSQCFCNFHYLFLIIYFVIYM